MKASHPVQFPTLLLRVLLAANALFKCYAADKPELNGLTDEEAKYAKLYWDYTVADRVIHPANSSGGGATASDSEGHIASEGTRTGYRFFVPHFERLSGLAYVGHGARMRLVLERASSGKHSAVHGVHTSRMHKCIASNSLPSQSPHSGVVLLASLAVLRLTQSQQLTL